MRKLEERHPEAVAVVGVHSGKYTTERDTARIREAAIRLGVHHPVVNDRQFRVWRSYAVRAWPTLVAISPDGYVIGMHAGEFTAAALEPFVERTLAGAESNRTLVRGPQPTTRDAPAMAPGTLRYPGKVALDGSRMAIADTGHDRVILGRLSDDGASLHIERIVGGERGVADGLDGRFAAPQGMAFDGGTLFVADAGNHALRAIDLSSGFVRTVAGTGEQLRTRRDREAGALSSPWDVTIVGTGGDRRLYVAMAGRHQLWSVAPTGEQLRVHAGSGAEELADGPAAEAALAQPMGLVADRERLWFVDAESSAVRWCDVATDGTVGTVIGTGLFDFGDRDGTGDDVRMQHQQALAVAPDGRLLVCDSYNDALKWIDPTPRTATTWVRGLHEPSGLAMGRDVVYVADTNAHRIAIVRLADGAISELAID